MCSTATQLIVITTIYGIEFLNVNQMCAALNTIDPPNVHF